MMGNLKQRVHTALGNDRGETISSVAIGSLVSTVITLAVSASMVGMIAVQHKVEERTETATGYASVEHRHSRRADLGFDIPSVEARSDRFTTISTGIGTEDDCQASTWSKEAHRLILTRQTYPDYSFTQPQACPFARVKLPSRLIPSCPPTSRMTRGSFSFLPRGKRLSATGMCTVTKTKTKPASLACSLKAGTSASIRSRRA